MFIQVIGTRPNRCSADAYALPEQGVALGVLLAFLLQQLGQAAAVDHG